MFVVHLIRADPSVSTQVKLSQRCACDLDNVTCRIIPRPFAGFQMFPLRFGECNECLIGIGSLSGLEIMHTLHRTKQSALWSKVFSWRMCTGSLLTLNETDSEMMKRVRLTIIVSDDIRQIVKTRGPMQYRSCIVVRMCVWKVARCMSLGSFIVSRLTQRSPVPSRA